MAWENCYIVENQAEFLKLTSLPASPQSVSNKIHDSGYKSDLAPAVNDYNQWINCTIDVALNPNTVLFENATWKLWTTSSQLYLSKNNVVIAQFPNNPFDTTNWRYWRRSFWACIDSSTQKGILGIAYVIQGTSYNWFAYVYRIEFTETRPNNDELIYEFLTNALPIQYTWQSVPSVSGKNGILSLVTLDSESINDGEPVSGAAVSVFDQAPSNDNNVKNLADTYGSGEASSAVDVTVKYKVTLPPGGIFDVLKLVAKKDSIPEDASDGDKIIDISPSKTKKTVTGLDENSMYYFKIFAEDSNGSTSESDEKHITTSGDEGWSFDYTGEIQTFVAPKTGIYQLETWGAQGGDATDGTNTARGGYGAYAVGEVFLSQGDTLYINVGGQNGYGGGGLQILDLFDIFKTIDVSHYKENTNIITTYDFVVPSSFNQYGNTDWMLFWGARQRRMPTISNKIITFANTGGGSESCVLIPIKHIENIVSFELSVQLSSIPYSSAYAHIGLANFDETNGFTFIADTDIVYIYGDNVTAQNQWFDFKKTFNSVNADYLAIMYLIDGKHEIKNLFIEHY